MLLGYAALASGQVARQGVVLSGSGRPVAGASIWVCTGNVTVTLTATPPCTPAQNIYTDYAQTHLVTQPLLTDGLGNYLYYIAAGTYTEVVTGPNTLGYSAVLTLGVIAGGVTATGSPASGNLAKFSGSNSVTNGDLSGDVTTSGSLAATLANSGVTAGSCGDSTHTCGVTFDAKGRATLQVNNSIAWAVPSVFGRTGAIAAASGDYTFSQIAGTMAPSQLPTPGPTTLGGIESIVANSNLWIDAISNLGVPHQSQPAFSNLGGTLGASQFGPLTGDVTTSGFAATLSNTGVTAGSCGDITHTCALTLDAKGRVTNQVNDAISFPVTSVFGVTGAVGNLTGDVTTSGSTATTLANSGVSAGSCGDATHSCSITVDAKGRTTALTNNVISGVVDAVPGNGNPTVNGNTTAAQTLTTYTIPAGAENAIGKTFRITVSVIATNGIGVAENISGGLKFGAGTFPVTSGQSVANGAQLVYTFTAVCMTDVTGASGFLSCSYPSSTIFNGNTFVNPNVTGVFSLNPIDLTSSITVSPYVQFSGASTSNTGGLVQTLVEQLN